jgi:hypothetical protein
MSILAKAKINEPKLHFGSSLNQIIFEHIDEEYAYGKYAEFIVVMRKTDRYINASKLCSDYKKRFDNWTRNDGNKELINIVNNKLIQNRITSKSRLSSDTNNQVYNPSMIQITTKKHGTILRGTYVHELLIPHIASWISPVFGIMVSEIINSHIASEYIKTIQEKDNAIKQKDDKIDELKLMMQEMKQRSEEAEKRAEERDKKATKRSKKLEDKLDDTNVKLDVINEELIETKHVLKSTSKKLNIAVEDRVIKPEDENILEYFILLKNRRKNPDYKYYAIRGQKRYISIKLNQKLNDKYKEVFRISGTPNSVDILNKLKKNLGKKIKTSLNNINLETINEEEFIETIKQVYDERKVINVDPVVESADEASDSDNE